jgi:hypothetical protein
MNENLAYNLAATAQHYPDRPALRFDHSTISYFAVSSGASLALVQRFDPAAVPETIERDKVTVFEGAPTMYAALLHHSERERYDRWCSRRVPGRVHGDRVARIEWRRDGARQPLRL